MSTGSLIRRDRVVAVLRLAGLAALSSAYLFSHGAGARCMRARRPRVGRWIARGLLLPVLLAGCATLTPAQERSAADVRLFANKTARLYGLPPLPLLVSHNPDSPPGSYRRGFFSISALTLDSTFRDAIVAHELAHYVLGHDAPLPGATTEELKHAYQQRELDANATSVEIIAKVGRVSEERALKTVYAYLLGIHWALERYPRLNLSGHKPPCEEIADLLSRFPAERVWTASLECAPESLGHAVGPAGGAIHQ